jgi:hypothetical protein
VKVFVQLVVSLTHEGTMKLKANLMGAMGDLINDLFERAGERDQLVECECPQDKFNTE